MNPFVWIRSVISTAIDSANRLVAAADERIGRYRKFAVAAAGTVILIAGRLLGEDSTEFAGLVSLCTSLGVYRTPNTKGNPDGKVI